MWIRSQDDRLLIDADKIYVSGTDDPKYQMGDFKYQIYNIGESCNYFLGDYSSKEKAMRVLDEIENQLNEFDLEGTVVYQMPQDEEVDLWFPEKDDSDEDDDI